MTGEIDTEKKSQKVVKTKVGEMVAKAIVGSNISSIITPVGLITGGPGDKAVERAVHIKRKSLSATYVRGCIPIRMPRIEGNRCYTTVMEVAEGAGRGTQIRRRIRNNLGRCDCTLRSSLSATKEVKEVYRIIHRYHNHWTTCSCHGQHRRKGQHHN